MRQVLIAIIVMAAPDLIAAPNQRRYELDDLRHEVDNQQAELRVYEEKLGTLDATLETLQKDLLTLKKIQKDKMALAAQDVDARIGSMDLASKKIADDFKALKDQANETVAALGQLKNRLAAVEKVIDGQNQNIDALQAALRSMAEVLQIKEGIKATKTYVVKSGDSLEKIARAHQMGVEALKELNGLTSTKIIIGQKLLVYDK